MANGTPNGGNGDPASDCLEIINIRLYDPGDRQKIITFFERMAHRCPGHRFTLYRNAAIAGDWSIHVRRPISPRAESKSPEARCLLELLREIGLVHHNVWLTAGPGAENE